MCVGCVGCVGVYGRYNPDYYTVYIMVSRVFCLIVLCNGPFVRNKLHNHYWPQVYSQYKPSIHEMCPMYASNILKVDVSLTIYIRGRY